MIHSLNIEGYRLLVSPEIRSVDGGAGRGWREEVEFILCVINNF